MLVVEGFQTVQDGTVEAALGLVREGRAGEVIVVLLSYPEKERLFAIQEHYSDRLGEELERRGLKKGQYRIGGPFGNPVYPLPLLSFIRSGFLVEAYGRHQGIRLPDL